MNFSERLKALRLEKGLKQEELANPLGLKRPAISKYETANQQPDFDRLIMIADYFDVSLDYLLGRSDIRKTVPLYNINEEQLELLKIFDRLLLSEKQKATEIMRTLAGIPPESNGVEKGSA